MNSSKTYKVVVITSRFPYPLEKGDKLRAYHQIKQLSQHFEVHLICTSEHPVSDDEKAELHPFCKSIHAFTINGLQKIGGMATQLFIGKKPFQIGYFYHYTIHKKINKILTSIQPDHIYCQLIRAAEYVKNYHNCTKTIDYMDALSKGMERRADKAILLRKFIFKKEHLRLLHYENSIFEYYENHTIISEQDKNYIFHQNKEQIHIIPNGIDQSFLTYTTTSKPNKDLVFIGNMAYPPNIQAAQFIVNELLPLLPSTITVKIVGSSPTKDVLKLASKQVEVTGFVDDIKNAYKSATIFIAPMFLGTGLQNKLLEAMALGVPCITTTLANNALGAEPTKELLIADTKEAFKIQILQLLQNDAKRKEIIENARTFIKNNYQWDAVSQKLIELVRQ